MRILTSWLKEFVHFTVPVETLAEDLTMAGLEVEEIEPAYKGLAPVVVCSVEEIVPHSHASHLQVCTVIAGEQRFDVVCGAPNVEKRQMAALARPGTVLSNGTTVKSSDIYGIHSDGMLCSEAELGIGDNATGILILEPAPGCEPGKSLVDVLGLKDWVLDIAVTPNRPDCLSVQGVAREVSAIYGIPLTIPQSPNHQITKSPNHPIPISIEAPDLCGRYTAAVMEGIMIGPSPHWMAMRLQASGIRPINNVVDVTNYVLIELGQPLHAFDLDMLTGPAIEVRPARPGEKIKTIDGKDKELLPDMLVIADAERPVAVAGVMGGAETEVNDDTKRILLESAWFAPTQVRRTSKALKTITESSYRFERGVDPEGVISALYRTVELIGQVTGGCLVGEIKDIYPRPYKPGYLSLRPEKANKLLGTGLEPGQIAQFLERIGIELDHVDDEKIRGTVPTYRLDLKEEVDLVEEIARLHGFPNIPTQVPRAGIVTRAPEPSQGLVDRIRTILSSQGMTEVISYSFMSPEEIEALGLGKNDPRMQMVSVQNPLSDDQSVMRTSIIPSLMGTVARNQARRNMDLGFFEIGTVFYARGTGELPLEEQRIVALCTGARYPESWSLPKEQVDLFDLKGVLQGLLQALGISEWKTVLETPDPFYLPGTSAGIVWGGNSVLGSFGQIDPDVLEFWDINGPVFVFELSFNALETAASRQLKFTPLARYPAVERDIAVIVPDRLSAQDLLEYISGQAPDFLEEVRIFDIYRGKPVPEGSKSIGMRFTYRALDHTLSDQEVSEVHDPLVRAVLQSYKAKLRD
ncbi:MAG: phenylalanine--tRNA ligase subunit beta, partial [Deltaproteobacteria bacterium]|nr:phenylalanine--tRNA ligase subunit beta [Deltaproteobacteria bacterium]